MNKPTTAKLLTLSFIFVAGCQAPNDYSAQIQSLETRLAAVEKQLASGVVPVVSSPAESPAVSSPSPSAASATPSQVASPAASTDHDLWKQLSYDSLPTPNVLKELVSLGFLPKAGITNQAELEAGLTRGQYVALLVEMNNLMHESDGQIRLARDGDGQTFDDVPASHPYYKYIQGMVNAGYVIGFHEKSFQPDKPLTREEMIAIAAKRDYDFQGFDSNYHWEHYIAYTDKNDIAPKYREAINRDDSAREHSNLREAFGESKLLHPKKEVRAYEAVLTLQKVGDYSVYRYNDLVNEAMGRP